MQNYLTCADGYPLAYRRLGQGPTLILLHGWACPGRFFDPLLPHLAEHYTLWIPDQRGHGASESPPTPPLLEDLARDLAALIELASPGRVHLLGWSMGAMVALEYLRQFGGERLERLCLVDMTAKVVNDADWELGLEGFDAAAALQSLRAMLEDWNRYRQLVIAGLTARVRQPDEREISWCLTRMGHSEPRDLASLWVSLCSKDYRPMLPAVSTPTLVIGGGTSRLYRRASLEYLTAHLGQARLSVLADCGHAPHLEAPEIFLRQVLDFFSTA